jgi:hypothetical protein
MEDNGPVSPVFKYPKVKVDSDESAPERSLSESKFQFCVGDLIHATHLDNALEIIKCGRLVPKEVNIVKDPNGRKQYLKKKWKNTIFTAALPTDSSGSLKKNHGAPFNILDQHWKLFQKTETYKKLYEENRYGGVVFHIDPNILNDKTLSNIGTNIYWKEHSHMILASSVESDEESVDMLKKADIPLKEAKHVWESWAENHSISFCKDVEKWEQVEVVFDTELPIQPKSISFSDHHDR